MVDTSIVSLQHKILSWYASHKRDLPWRHTRDPYKVLVSEVMLQQTQVSRVLSKYEAWLEKFPTITDVANAKTSEVLAAWSGLGYNRRALHLKQCAGAIVGYSFQNASSQPEKYVIATNVEDSHTTTVKNEDSVADQLIDMRHPGSKFVRNDKENPSEILWPQTEAELMKLPGIGKYTARALLCFAFDQQVAVVDTNVRKVIATQFLSTRQCGESTIVDNAIISSRVKKMAVDNARKKKGVCLKDAHSLAGLHEIASSQRGLAMTDKEVWKIADQLVPSGRAYDWNQALMDYASAVLKQEKIPIPKQSKFAGSRRYYRGRIIKLLLTKPIVSLADIEKYFQSDLHGKDTNWLIGIIAELEREGFLFVTHGMVNLKL